MGGGDWFKAFRRIDSAFPLPMSDRGPVAPDGAHPPRPRLLRRLPLLRRRFPLAHPLVILLALLLLASAVGALVLLWLWSFMNG